MFGLTTIRRGPESEIIPEELHDQRAIAVGLLGQGVELGNSIIKGLLGKVARTVRRVQDLIVEDGEVERKTKADGVGGSQLSLRNVGCILEELSSEPRKEDLNEKGQGCIPCKLHERR